MSEIQKHLIVGRIIIISSLVLWLFGIMDFTDVAIASGVCVWLIGLREMELGRSKTDE